MAIIGLHLWTSKPDTPTRSVAGPLAAVTERGVLSMARHRSARGGLKGGGHSPGGCSEAYGAAVNDGASPCRRRTRSVMTKPGRHGAAGNGATRPSGLEELKVSRCRRLKEEDCLPRSRKQVAPAEEAWRDSHPSRRKLRASSAGDHCHAHPRSPQASGARWRAGGCGDGRRRRQGFWPAGGSLGLEARGLQGGTLSASQGSAAVCLLGAGPRSGGRAPGR